MVFCMSGLCNLHNLLSVHSDRYSASLHCIHSLAYLVVLGAVAWEEVLGVVVLVGDQEVGRVEGLGDDPVEVQEAGDEAADP